MVFLTFWSICFDVAIRQLAAIVFTDIEGYTAIMQQDEQQALTLRNCHREVLQKEHAHTMAVLFSVMGMGCRI